jgi:predicted ATP-grasp superfamily ATP-dependent carboligase
MAFVTDALLRKSVVVCQALGRQGIDVAAGSTTRLSPAFFSRYCRGQLLYPSPVTRPAEFVQTLLEYLRRHYHPVLLPMDDASLAVIAAHRTEFERVTHVPIPPREQLAYGLDKAPAMRLARKLGIAHPRTALPTTLADADAAAHLLRPPLVVKPRASCGGRGIAYVTRPEDAAQAWAAVHAQHPLPMLQETIPGREKFDVGILMDANHQPVASFVQRELRHFPLRDGLSTLQESVWRPDLVERAVALLQAIGWYGLAEVEFMTHPGTGETLLLEINPRFWASIQLAVSCGIDFPTLLHRLARGERVTPAHRYAVGRRCRWLLPGDLLHFLVNPARLQMEPSFFDLGRTDTIYDGFYPADKRATLGVLLSTAHYAFDADLWRMLTRGRTVPRTRPTALPTTRALGTRRAG